jgi:hypothetical protein
MRRELDKLDTLPPEADPWAEETTDVDIRSPFFQGRLRFRGRRFAMVAGLVAAGGGVVATLWQTGVLRFVARLFH